MRAGLPGQGALTGVRREARVLSGRFVWRGGDVWLESDRGDQWGPEWYGIAHGGWGWDEGTAKLPRPWRFDARGAVLVEGDMVLIEFVNGNTDSPLARPGPARPTRVDWLSTSFAAGGAERVRVQHTARDVDTGAELGSYREEIAVRDGAMVNTIEADQVRVQTIGGSAERVVLGESYISAENQAYLQASPILVAAAGFFGLPFEDIVAFAGQLATSDTEAGIPFLARVLRAE